MSRKQGLVMLGAAFLTVVSPLTKARNAVQNGADYLVSYQADDGSWNPDAKLKLVDSMECFQALRRVSGREVALNRSLQFFAAVSEDNHENLARKLSALASSTATLDNYVARLAAGQKKDGGWGLVESKRGSIPHTLLAVNALLASGKASADVLSRACGFLTANQHNDGSWIYGGEHSFSDITHTAMALLALKKVQTSGTFSSNELEQAIARATNYLEINNDNGSYGSIVDTAWAYLALSRIKQPAELQQTLAIITGLQQENGSWNNNIYDTAVCLQALTAIQVPRRDLPDLAIAEAGITFSPAAPLTGNQVVVSAVVFNQGELDAENVKIEFFSRDPRLGGTEIAPPKTVPLIPADGSAVVDSSFIAHDLVGAQQIVVFIDRDNLIDEATKANNAAAKTLVVGGMPDLAIAAEDIVLSNPNPAAFETVDLIVTVHNAGNEAARNVPVRIFDNDKLLSEIMLAGINAGGAGTATITTGFSAETHVIRVEIDPEHTVAGEVNLDNNVATISFVIEKDQEKPLDLAVESIAFDPAVPLSGAPAKITVVVANLGGADATDAFDTTLLVDGVAAGVVAVPQLLGGQKAVLNFENISLAAGERVVSAVADAENIITADTNRANNTMHRAIFVQADEIPAAIDIVSFSATPATAVAGGTVVFKAVLMNTGTQPANNVIVALSSGTEAFATAVVPSLAGGQLGELLFEYAFLANGDYPVVAVASLDESTAEKNTLVSVTGASDLEITAANIVLPTAPVVAFEQFGIAANIRNLGNVDAINVPVRFLANGETLAAVNLSGVAAGGSNRATLTTSLPKGDYNIIVQIDPEKTLENEHNLTNNTAWKTLTVSAPAAAEADIAVEAILFNPALPIQGSPVDITARIINAGGTDVQIPFSVEFRDGPALLESFTVPSLAAGQKAELRLAANLAVGEHIVGIVADSANVVAESDKSNNSLARQITVQAAATPPDLTVQSLTMDKGSANVMDNVMFTAAVFNAGTTAAENFFVGMTINGETPTDDYKIAALPGGGVFNLQIPWRIIQEGENIVQITADSTNVIAESDETNNVATLSFLATAIPRPDLTIPAGGLTLDPTTPQPSTPFILRTTVGNIGNADAVPARLLVTVGHPRMSGAVRLAEADIPAIPAGNQAAIHVPLKLGESSQVYVLVDSDDDIAEADESNNLFLTAIPVQPLPDLMIDGASLSVSHVNLELGQFVKLTGMVSNLGSVAAPASGLRLLAERNGVMTLIASPDTPAIAPGTGHEFTAFWSPGRGSSRVIAQADYENLITESTKENNAAEKTFVFSMPASEMKLYRVEHGGEFQTSEYKAGQLQKIRIIHSYSDAVFYFTVYNPDGEWIASSFDRQITSGEFTWDTGQNAPVGDNQFYTATTIVATKDGDVMEQLQESFVILPSATVVFAQPVASPASVISGRQTTVELAGAIVFTTNISSSFDVRLKLFSPGGDVLLSDTKTVDIGQDTTQMSIGFETVDNTFSTAGEYPLLLEIIQNEEVLYSKTGKIVSLPEIRVKVTKTITPDVLPSGTEGRVKVEIKLKGIRE